MTPARSSNRCTICGRLCATETALERHQDRQHQQSLADFGGSE